MKNVFLLLLLACAFCVPVKAQPFFWAGAGGNWNDPNNWYDLSTSATSLVVPGDADEVIFVDEPSLNLGGDCVIDVSLTGRTGAFTIESGYTGQISTNGGVAIEGVDLYVYGGEFYTNNASSVNFTNVIIDNGILSLGSVSSGTTFGNLTLSSGIFAGGTGSILITELLAVSGGSFTSTSGVMILSNSSSNLFDFSGGTFAHNGGTVTLDVGDGNKQISSGVTFNNLTISNSVANTIYTLDMGNGTTTVLGNMTFSVSSGTGTISMIGGGTTNLSGNLAAGTFLGTGNPSHDHTISLIKSTGVPQQLTGPGTISLGRGRLPSIAINQTGTGSLALSGGIIIAGNLTRNGTTTISPGSSTVAFIGPSRVLNGTGTMTFNILNVGLSGTLTGTLTLATPVNITAATGNGLVVNTSSILNTAGNTVTVTAGVSLPAGATLNTTSGVFSFGGAFSTNATATFNPGTTVFNLTGSSSQSVDFRSTGTMNINTLNCTKTGGTASITEAIIITNLLTCTGGTLNANNITLASTAAGTTAQVGNSTGGTYTGSATIQRYIGSKATRKWYFLAAPVASGPSITNSWQTQMYVTGSGTGTGPVGTANYNSNGFDWTASNSPSIYTYNETLAGGFNTRWATPATTSTTLNSGTGYRVFVRGARGAGTTGQLDGSVTSQSAVTLSVLGAIPSGNRSVSISCSNGCTSNDGWNLVGNPYPATIDWNSFQTTNSTLVTGTYYVLDPNSQTYHSWNGTTGSASRYISSGQSFWVKKSASGTTNVTFAETHKAVSQSGSAAFKTASEPQNLVKLTLSGTGFSNDAYVHLNSTGQYEMDNFDAYKLSFANYQVATFNTDNSTRLDINNLPEFGTKTIDTIDVDVKLPVAAGNYNLSFSNISSFASNLKVVLEDKLNSTYTDLRANNAYSFSTNGNANSAGDRFRILVSNTSTPLPVDFMVLQAKMNNKNVDLTWSTVKEVNNRKFVVEHSTDGKAFSEIGDVKGAGNSSIKNDYAFTHNKPQAGIINYYRVKQVDYSGKYSYSNICFVAAEVKKSITSENDADVNGEIKLSLYPVPATNNLTIQGISSEAANVKVYSVYGDEVLTAELGVEEGKANMDVTWLSAGVYVLELTDGNGLVTRTKFNKQ